MHQTQHGARLALIATNSSVHEEYSDRMIAIRVKELASYEKVKFY